MFSPGLRSLRILDGGKESNQNWIESGEERRDEDDDDEIRSQRAKYNPRERESC